MSEAAVDLRSNILYRWKKQHEEQQTGGAMILDERIALIRLRGENYPCREDMICEVEDYIKY